MKPFYINVNDRIEIAQFMNDRGLVGEAAEIGVAFGGYSRGMLKTWKGMKYYLVDLWAPQPTKVYREKHDQVNFVGHYEDCVRLSEEDSRVVIVREDSVKAAKLFKDESLDFVFIDANHSFEAVTADMNAWWPKVKVGGIFSGHDYGLDTNFPNWCEVKTAVDMWCLEHWIPFVASRDSSWWCCKVNP